MKTDRVFAYIVNTDGTRGSGEMICPKCALEVETPLEGCHWSDYSFGYEVIGCNWCEQTLDTPF